MRAAEYVKQHLFSNLIKHPKFITDTKAAIGTLTSTVVDLILLHKDNMILLLSVVFSAAEAYNHTDSEFLKVDRSKPGPGAGSTAVTAIFVGGRLLVANVGDSRAVICRGRGKFIF